MQVLPINISHSCPDLGEEEIAAVVGCLRSLQVKGGERVRALESRLARDLGYAGGVATTTGGNAIFLLLRAMFASGGARVGLPSYVCRSVYDAICMAGCRPVVLDIDLSTFSVSLAEATSNPLDAIIVPHMFGIRAPMERFMAAGLTVIEDCAQRIPPLDLAQREPRAPFRILSFEATKLLCSGEGGLLLADDPVVLARARNLRDAPYEFPEPALALPFTDIQAAIALAQWQRLGPFLSKRSRIAEKYLAQLGAQFRDSVVPAMWAQDTYHFRFLLSVDKPDEFLSRMASGGVTCRRPIAPLPLHVLFGVSGRFPASDRAFERLVSLPLYPRLTDEATTLVSRVVSHVLGASSREAEEAGRPRISTAKEGLSMAFLTGTDKSTLLRSLLDDGVRLVAIVVPSSKMLEERFSPVITFAEREGIPVIRPKRAKLETALRQLSPDVLLSAGYPYLLSAAHLSVAKFNINVHPTLLPRYRGQATAWHVIAYGEMEGGVTVHFMDEGMDTGPILCQVKVPLTPFDTVRSLRRKTDEVEPLVVREALGRLTRCDFDATPQDPSKATTFPEIRTPEDSRIDASQPLAELYNFIRACDPDRFPAFFEVAGQRVGIRLFRLQRPEGEDDLI